MDLSYIFKGTLMDHKVGKDKHPSNQLQSPKPEGIPVPEQPNKTNWLQRVVQKIISAVKWIKDSITFKHGTKITTIGINNGYIEPIKKKN